MKSKSFQDLIVWQKSHKLVLEVYQITSHFPKEEIYGLTSQLRRAAVSVPANIAEGFGRTGIKDNIKFYTIAAGSLNELEYYIILSKDLNYLNSPLIFSRIAEVGRLLNAYSGSLKV